MAHERICIVCGTSYKYCRRCGKYTPRQGGEMFCSDNCRDIFNVCSRFVTGKISAIEAKALLDNLDLSNIENFQKALKGDIERIMQEAAPVDVETTSEVVIEEAPAEEVVAVEEIPAITAEPEVAEEVAEETVSEIQVNSKRKKNKRRWGEEEQEEN